MNDRRTFLAGTAAVPAILALGSGMARAAAPATHGGKVRRVVAGNNTAGHSFIVSDELVSGQLWQADPSHPLGPLTNHEAPLLLPSTAPHLDPPPGGSTFQLISLPTWREMKPIYEKGEIKGLDTGGFHRTSTIDYIVMISGPLEVVLDEGKTMLAAGDVFIQRNTLHSWRNLTDGPIDFAVTMVRI
jgi:hypothetical protein